jgi:serine/threonine protein kinase
MSSDLRPGSRLSEYRIERLIGRGGMGVVYQAEHTHLGKRVALKVLPPEYTKDTAFRERFEREARLAASLEHPNIVPVTDAGEFEGELWIAMRYVDGTDLREALNERGTLNPIRAVSILGRVASALDTAHAAGLVHRDVKPGNILLEPPSATRQVEHVYLTDFGLTKQVDAGDDAAGHFATGDRPRDADLPVGPEHESLGPDHGPPEPDAEPASKPERGVTRAGYFAGTVDYAAPEQFRGEPLDGRVDVYALGCVLYECLTGRVPFAGEDEQHTMLMHIQAPIPKASALTPGIPRGLDAVIARAMAKDRDARFPTCRELVDAARSFLAGWDPSSLEAARVVPAAPGPPPGSIPSTSSGSFSAPPSSVPSEPSGSFPGQQSVPAASAPSVPPASVPSEPSGTFPAAPGAPAAAGPGSQTSGKLLGAAPSDPSAAGVPLQPSTPSTPLAPGPSSSPSHPAPARSGFGGSNPLLTWVLVGIGAAIVVVLLLVLLAR